MTLTLIDQAQRDRLAGDLDGTLFVEAGAGTGKTTAVVSRVVANVAAGRLVMERLVAITFTVAAAGDLRVRIREGLEAAGEETARTRMERDRCRTAAGELERARIETIHAFCSHLLRLFPLEAGLPPDFIPLDALSANIDARERFRQWFDRLTADSPGGEAVRRGLLLGATPKELLAIFKQLGANWDLLAAARPWGAELPADLIDAVRGFGDVVARAVALLAQCHNSDGLAAGIESMQPLGNRLRSVGTIDAALASLVALNWVPALRRGSVANWAPGVCQRIKFENQEMRAAVAEVLNGVRAAVAGGIATVLRTEVLAYAEERRERGLVSYQDLLVRARDLVRHHRPVREALRERWSLIVVDEFQDTDPLQAELAFLLAGRAGFDDQGAWTDIPLREGVLCLVGDPKQSIYRFRRADINLYQSAQRAVAAGHADARAFLQVNFRSGQLVVDAVNHVFAGDDGLMAAGVTAGVQAPYVDLVAHDPTTAGSVSVFGDALDERAPAMWREEAKATAAVISRITGEGWQVDAGTTAGPRSCTASDICILMPSRTNLRNLERELESARIRYRLESGALMIATQEVRDLISCLRSIDDPSDEVALIAALRSPGYGCSDSDLLRWHEAGGRWSYERPALEDGSRVCVALHELRELREMRQNHSVPALVEELISRRLLRAIAADDWRPQETLRRQRYVLDQVSAIGRTGRTTLHDAVEHLEQRARDPEYDSVIGGDGDEDCVRVMTIHAAKGLEFPVVLVTGFGRSSPLNRSIVLSEPTERRVEVKIARDFATAGWDALLDREKGMEEGERVRLMYVAVTRARDHLVVSRFRCLKAGEKTDAHQLHLRLAGVDGVGRLDTTPLARPASPAIDASSVETDAEAHRVAEEAWVARRTQLLAEFGSLPAITATGLAHEPDLPIPEAATDVAAERRGRGGTSLGRAVHAVLQVIDLRSLAELSGHAAAQAAAEGIPERAGEVEGLVRSACESDAVKRAAAARHWRELPMGATIDGVIVEGFIDLLYEDPDGRLVVLDYKTDMVGVGGVDERIERYRLQGGVYAMLTHETTGREVARIEFVFASPGVTRAVEDVAGAIAMARAAVAGRAA